MLIFRPNNKLITLIQDTRPNEYLLTPEAFMHVLWHKDWQDNFLQQTNWNSCKEI